jgi:hypothetical protein
MGHNLTPKQLEERGYESHPYVEKYRKYNQLNREPNSEPQDVYNTDKVLLASQTSAPLPHFANTKGEVPEYPNLIKSFLNSVEEGVDELNSYRKNLQKKLNLSDEVVKSVLWQIAASAALGSVKNIGKIANKFTKSAISKKQLPKAIAKKPPAVEEKRILDSLADNLKDEVTEISKMPKSAMPKKLSSPTTTEDFLEPSYFAKPPVAEEVSMLNRLTDNLKDEVTEISKKPKKIAIPKKQPSPAVADDFLEPSYFAKPPVAEEEAILNRLADNLKDEVTEISKKPKAMPKKLSSPAVADEFLEPSYFAKPPVAEEAGILNKLADDLKEEVTEISKKPKPSPMPKRRPPIAEIDKGEDEITRRIDALIKSESRFPKRKPSPRIIEELKEPSYFAKPPVAEEEAILKRLVDSLNREIK